MEARGLYPAFIAQIRPPAGQAPRKGVWQYGIYLCNSYLQGVYEDVCKKNAHEPEFLQAVGEVPESLQPVVEQNQRLAKSGVIDRIVEPERSLLFRISWVDDHGRVQVNRGYRVQFSTAMAPPGGSLQFHPSQITVHHQIPGLRCSNSLTGLPYGRRQGRRGL